MACVEVFEAARSSQAWGLESSSEILRHTDKMWLTSPFPHMLDMGRRQRDHNNHPSMPGRRAR